MKDICVENYNSPALVSLWTDFIDWEKRRAGENGFLTKKLKEAESERVLDAALGDGCDSIHLLKEGFEVISNDIDTLFIESALEHARAHKVNLKITQFDWREFDEKFAENYFDAIILLGNTLTYLFRRKDQLKTLKNFLKILRPKGILIIDERNYRYLAENRDEILSGNFRYSKRYVYCGEKVHALPTEIKDNKVAFEYLHDNGTRGHLIFYPFKFGEMKELLQEAGFSKIEEFSDYAPGYNHKSDFCQYVAWK